MIVEWVILFILVAIFIFIIVFGKFLYSPDPTQFGNYSLPGSSVCLDSFKSTSDCGSEGTQQVREECIPNFLTGYGCIDPNTGEQTYRPQIRTQSCRVDCPQTTFKNTPLAECQSYFDVNEVDDWIYFPQTDPVQPTLPEALPIGECSLAQPNAFQLTERVCTQVNSAGTINQCTFINPRTGRSEEVGAGFTYQTFLPCKNSINSPCGNWVPCPGYTHFNYEPYCQASSPGEFFKEQILYSPRVCQTQGNVSCTSLTDPFTPEGNVGLPSSGQPCLIYPSSAPPNTTCDRTQFELNANPTVCSSYSPDQLGTLLTSSNLTSRRAFTPQSLAGNNVPSTVLQTTVTLASVSCIGANPDWKNNPACISFCRTSIDNFNYPNPQANLVKNRAGFLMTVSSIGTQISSYLNVGTYSEITSVEIATSLDFEPIKFSSISTRNGCSSCSPGQIINDNGLILFMIPTAQNNLYKIAGLARGEVLGWLVSGTTLQTFFPNSAQLYFQAEIDQINTELAQLEQNQSPIPIGPGSLVEQRNHLCEQLNNWNQITGSISSNELYWVPSRFDLTRQSLAVAPVQDQADLFSVEFAPFSKQNSTSFYPEIVSVQTPNSLPVQNRTYQVTQLINTVNNQSLLSSVPANMDVIYATSVPTNQFRTNIPGTSPPITVQNLIDNLSLDDPPLPDCRI